MRSARFSLFLGILLTVFTHQSLQAEFADPGYFIEDVFSTGDFDHPNPAFPDNWPPSVSCLQALPDGRVFIGTGDLRGYLWDPENDWQSGEAVLPGWFLDYRGRTAGEMGMVGCVASPDYETTGHFYVSYTVEPEPGNRRIRLERFTADPIDKNAVIPEPNPVEPGQVGLQVFDIPDANQGSDFHFGGGLAFGPDGNLYWSLGDDADTRNPQILTSYRGKVLRMTPSGEPLPSNPFYNGEPITSRDYIYSLGLRNPFRLRYDSELGIMYATDTGQSLWEELNRITPGSNHGWALIEGPLSDNPGVTPPPDYTEPFYNYRHGEEDFEGSSIVSLVKYQGSMFPDEVNGDLLVTEWGNIHDDRRGKIFRLMLDGEGNLVDKEVFYRQPRLNYGLSDITILPDDSLLLAVTGNVNGRVQRITYQEPDNPPSIAIEASTTEGPAPLSVQFTANVDDEGTPAISWDFGDGTNAQEDSPGKTYLNPGIYTVTCTVTDEFNSTASDTLTIRAYQTLDNLLLSGTLYNAYPDTGPVLSSGTLVLFDGDGITLLEHNGSPVEIAAGPDGAFDASFSDLDYAGETLIGEARLGAGHGSRSFAAKIEGNDTAWSGDLYVSPVAIQGTAYRSDSDDPLIDLDVWISEEGEFGVLTPYEIPGGRDFQSPNAPVGYPWGMRTDPLGHYYFPIRESDESKTFVLEANLQQDSSGAVMLPDYVAVAQDVEPEGQVLEQDILLQFVSGGEGCDEAVPAGWYTTSMSEVQAIFDSHCIGCHAHVNPYEDLNLMNGFAYSSLVNRESQELPVRFLVEQRDPGWNATDNQYLFEKLACDAPSIGATMPPFGSKISGKELRDIAMWIRNGAPHERERVSIWASSSLARSPARIQFWGGCEAAAAPFRFEWDFGNGETAQGMNPIHEFQLETGVESYTVTVTAYDKDDNEVGTASEEITILAEDATNTWILQ